MQSHEETHKTLAISRHHAGQKLSTVFLRAIDTKRTRLIPASPSSTVDRSLSAYRNMFLPCSEVYGCEWKAKASTGFRVVQDCATCSSSHSAFWLLCTFFRDGRLVAMLYSLTPSAVEKQMSNSNWTHSLLPVNFCTALPENKLKSKHT